MKLYNKLTAVVLSALMVLGTGSTLFASEITPISETFTIDNIDNTLATVENSTYMISKDNHVMGVGTKIHGVGGVGTSFKWIPLVTSTYNTPITSIVKLESAGTGLYMVDANGDLYYTGNVANPLGGALSNTYCDKIDLSYKISKFEVLQGSSSVEGIGIVDSDGNGHTYISNAVVNVVSDVKFKDVRIIKSGTYATPVFLGVDGCLYSTNGSVIHKLSNNGNHIKNIESIHISNKNGSNLIVKNTSGNYLTLSGIDRPYGTVLTVSLLKLSSTGYTIDRILDTNSIKKDGSFIYVKTDKGVINLLNGSNVTNESVAFTYNDLATYMDNTQFSLGLDKTGNLIVSGSNGYGNTGEGTNINSTDIRVYKEDWMNSNPIIEKKEYSNFNIEMHEVKELKGNQLEINFSLLNTKKPDSFNIYYCKVSDEDNRLNWVLIGDKVHSSSLNATEIDNGYLEKNFSKTNYTYTWNVPKENLTSIKIIVEPIYN